MIKYSILVFMVGMIMLTSSCKKFLDVEPPVSKIPNKLVFSDDAAANSAAVGIYISLYQYTSFASGLQLSLPVLTGLSSDELVNLPKTDRLYLDFNENNIDPQNENVLNLWGSLYKIIYASNSIVEGLEASKSITPSTRAQLSGEALFMRAFCYFYLTNLFGEIPLVLNIDYKSNASIPRSSSSDVYSQIKQDLIAAEELLPTEYIGGERTRPNKSAASALLARIYLYTKDWARAEDKASKVINNINQYSLTILDGTFLANSTEAIWQVRPPAPDPLTNEAGLSSIAIAVQFNSLNNDIINSFEFNDQRLSKWIAGFLMNNSTIYLPAKYKRRTTGSTLPKEYSMVVRLAETYLIRSEARLNQDRLSEAISDLDMIRTRAGLPRIQDTNPGINKDDLLLAIEKERRIELLTEWGHRWFDLKRWNRANAVLSPIKPGWTSNDQLYPIPESELSKNQKLRPQNIGY